MEAFENNFIKFEVVLFVQHFKQNTLQSVMKNQHEKV